MSEKDLGRRFVTGGENELEEIIDTYGEKLLRYATAILCDYHEAENVVQEVFIAAYQGRAAFDGNNLSAWLYKITYNRSLNQLKKRKIFYFSDINNKINEVTVPAEDMGLSDETLCALQKLKPKDRALLFARIMDEQSYEELSLQMGCSTAALRKRYERAKNKMADYLTAHHTGKETLHEYI